MDGDREMVMGSNMDWCVRKLQEVAADLRDKPALRGVELEHQARKIDEVIRQLTTPDLEKQGGPPPVHGGGTGNQ